MNNKLYIAIPVLFAAIAFPRTSAAKDISGDWAGQLTGSFDSQYTAQYNHVMLKADGAKLSGTWERLQVGRNLGRSQGGPVLNRHQRQGSRHTHGRLCRRLLFRNRQRGTPSQGRWRRCRKQPPNAVTWKLTRGGSASRNAGRPTEL